MSITPNSPILLAIATGLGLLIGVERELRKGSGSHRGAAGVRTLALAGALSSYLNSEALLVAVAAGAVLFSALAYRHAAPKDSGLTCGAQNFHSMVSNEMSHCYICVRFLRNYGRNDNSPETACAFWLSCVASVPLNSCRACPHAYRTPPNLPPIPAFVSGNRQHSFHLGRVEAGDRSAEREWSLP